MITPAKYGYFGPGMMGPAVEKVQHLVGAPVTGVYDEETRLRVRGLQVKYGTTVQDGLFDEELERHLTPGMSS